MAIDILRMKPSECCRTLNSTSLGTVINDRQLYRYRTEAGIRIGDGTHVNLLQFSAWLIEKRHKPRTKMPMPRSKRRPVLETRRLHKLAETSVIYQQSRTPNARRRQRATFDSFVKRTFR